MGETPCRFSAPAPAVPGHYDSFRVRERTDHSNVEQNKMVTVHVLTMALKTLDKIRYNMLQRRRPVDRDTDLTGRD